MPARVLLFDAAGNDTELPFGPDPLQRPSERQLLWVDLTGESPPELGQVLGQLGLSPAVLGQLAQPRCRRPTLTQYGEYVCLNVNLAEQTTFEPMVVVAGDNFVVTSHPSEFQALNDFTEQMQGDTQLGQLDSAAFLAVLLSRMLESYFDAVGEIEEQTDRLDELVLRSGQSQEPLNELVELRRRVGLLRRELAAHRPLYLHLASPDFVVYAGDQHDKQFAALNVLFDHALESVAGTRDLILGSFDLYMSSLGRRTNDIMRVLTVVTLALGILAAVAGLMGMNFQADIFKSGNTGFRDVLLGSALLIALVLAAMRWRKWL